MTDFNTAKAYQIDGYDKYDAADESLIEWAADFGSIAELTAQCPVTINAYRLVERVHLDLDNLSDEMMTDFEEAYADENLGLTDDIDRRMDHEAYRRCRQAIWAALADFAETLPVTRLETKPFASRTYSVDEVVAILRELRPTWFRELG